MVLLLQAHRQWSLLEAPSAPPRASYVTSSCGNEHVNAITLSEEGNTSKPGKTNFRIEDLKLMFKLFQVPRKLLCVRRIARL